MMLAECEVGLFVNHGRCHRQRRFQQLVGKRMWRGSPGAELGALNRFLEFLEDFEYLFQDWVIFA